MAIYIYNIKEDAIKNFGFLEKMGYNVYKIRETSSHLYLSYKNVKSNLMVSIYVEFFDGFWDIQLVNGYRGYPFWKILNYLKVVYPKDLVIITNHNYSPPLERYAKYIETFCSDFLTGIIEVDKVIE